MVGHVERVGNVMHAKLLSENLMEGNNSEDLCEGMVLRRVLRRRHVCVSTSFSCLECDLLAEVLKRFCVTGFP